ncbi:hypothetical protein L1987_10946 [Smallanthus sonchifolius]|uniref:Uncharacterized protein n=1 Tax=Smallanthus sonchifolius TaxID=185202 RepID=A0ACB9JAI5_9ASTR|nr:hypothetical protein L1987_10946 [Smallanthus sonchifolius]
MRFRQFSSRGGFGGRRVASRTAVADVKATSEEQNPKTVKNLQGKPTEEQTNIKVTGDEQNAKAVQDGENGDQMANVSLADDGN